jgi:phage baseplate assembly protein W
MAQYSDIDFFLTKNELTNDISFKKDVFAVSQSLGNIALTRKNERVFRPDFGSDLVEGLQINKSDVELMVLKQIVKAQLETQEPRAIIDNIEFIRLQDGFKVNLTFHLKNNIAASGSLSLTV